MACGAVAFVGFTQARQGTSEIEKARKEPLAGRFSSDVALRYSTKLESKVGKEKEVSSVGTFELRATTMHDSVLVRVAAAGLGGHGGLAFESRTRGCFCCFCCFCTRRQMPIGSVALTRTAFALVTLRQSGSGPGIV